jgi:hypothetical protein
MYCARVYIYTSAHQCKNVRYLSRGGFVMELYFALVPLAVLKLLQHLFPDVILKREICNRYEFVTVSLLKRLNNGRFTSETTAMKPKVV